MPQGARQFASQADWIDWLDANHESSTGLWLRLAKAGSGISSVSYSEAVDAALCFGWIDGLKKAQDDKYWLQRFTPRSRSSIWSKNNREKALALLASGQMRPAGEAEIERARADGRWERAYDSAKTASIPDDFAAALEASPKAKAFFATLDSRNRYAVLFRIQTAKKADTRARRIRSYVEMLEAHETIYP